MTRALVTKYLVDPPRIRARANVATDDEWTDRVVSRTFKYERGPDPRENHVRAALTLAEEHDLLEPDMLSSRGYDLLSTDLPDGGMVHVTVPKRSVPRLGRWTLNITEAGRIFALGGKAAFELRCFVDHDPPLSPSDADSLAGEILDFLNTRKAAS